MTVGSGSFYHGRTQECNEEVIANCGWDLSPRYKEVSFTVEFFGSMELRDATPKEVMLAALNIIRRHIEEEYKVELVDA